jgi:hypothetical protein
MKILEFNISVNNYDESIFIFSDKGFDPNLYEINMNIFIIYKYFFNINFFTFNNSYIYHFSSSKYLVLHLFSHVEWGFLNGLYELCSVILFEIKKVMNKSA